MAEIQDYMALIENNRMAAERAAAKGRPFSETERRMCDEQTICFQEILDALTSGNAEKVAQKKKVLEEWTANAKAYFSVQFTKNIIG
jgi:hypothetical protein